jgi:LuxR family transcriptional regulator, regulator of acetate metabolism
MPSTSQTSADARRSVLDAATDAHAAATRAYDLATERLAVVPDGEVGALEDARSAVAEVVASADAATGPGSRPAGLRLILAIDDLLARIEERSAAGGLEASLRIQESMVRLREVTTAEGLVEQAPRELCRALGFSRAMISRVRLSIWVPEVLEIRSDADADAGRFRAFVEQHTIPLSHMLMEAEMVRRRIAFRVLHPSEDPRTYKPIVEAAGSTSYVAAPIMPADRVIGFLHADRFAQGLQVSEADRRHLWMFAEHFGLLYERAVLVRRLETQRQELRTALRIAADRIDAVCAADIDLVSTESPRSAPQAVRRSRATGDTRLGTLFTAREREVLDHLAEGATNAQIAAALVVSEGTVKTHVRRILRKTRASSRAEAVARYLRLLQQRTGDA